MDTRLITSLAVTLALWTPGVFAQQPVHKKTEVVPPENRVGARQQFNELTRQFETLLRESGGFMVDITSQWEGKGDGTTTHGTNVFRVVAADNGKIRIEAGSKETGESQLVCVSDGSMITRLHRPSKFYSQQSVSGGHDDIPHDAMTMQTLAGSGVDFLIRPRFRKELVAQLEQLQDLGTETIDGVRAHHFRAGLVGKRTYDVWFAEGKRPLLTKLITTITIPINETKTFRLVATNRLQWTIGKEIPTDAFAIQLPPQARKVNDLLGALQQGDIGLLIGKPAPALKLPDLDGNQVTLQAHRGRDVVVLIFWATWCAPSVNDMPALNEFVRQYHGKGVAIYAINLGESESVVKEFVQDRHYQGPVLLDPQAETLRSYGINAFPVTILIGLDGTVQAYHVGSAQQARTLIRQNVAALVAGKRLAPTNRK